MGVFYFELKSGQRLINKLLQAWTAHCTTSHNNNIGCRRSLMLVLQRSFTAMAELYLYLLVLLFVNVVQFRLMSSSSAR